MSDFDKMMQEVITKASAHGSNVGQVALAEFILKSYGEEIPEMLKRLLQKVCVQGYEGIAADVNKPAEDVALEVSKIMERVG